MKKPEPELSCFGGGRLSSPSPPPLGTISNGKFSKPGIERFSAWISTFEVTWIETTAGETRSKMSAKDSGAPGGGANTGAVDAWIRLPPCGVGQAAGASPGAGHGGDGDAGAAQGAHDECGLIDGHMKCSSSWKSRKGSRMPNI